MNALDFINYDEFQKHLDNNQCLITVAEVQGLLMGFYSGGLKINEQSWKEQLLKHLPVPDSIPQVIENELTRIIVNCVK